MPTKLPDTSKNLVSTIQSIGLDASFGPMLQHELEVIGNDIPLSSELIVWYQISAPIHFSFSWGNDVTLYAPQQLVDCQWGYKWDTSGERVADWPDSWLVLGDWGADPVIAHTDSIGTPVSMAKHGVGSWEPKIVAPDLRSFLAGITVWIELFYGKYLGDFRDEDCSIRHDVMDEFKQLLIPILDEPYRHYWPWGTAY